MRCTIHCALSLHNSQPAPVEHAQSLLFPDLAGNEPQALLDGSARLALQTDPPFDRYIFIERSPARCAHLENLKKEFPDRADRIDIQRGDANERIQKLCGTNKDWRSRRAVLFLDPYGMQVEWKTIEAIASTKAIFGDDQEHVVKATMETIGRYFNDRLKKIFAGVVEELGVLRNSANNPLFLLCFAVGNERGKGPALRIAEHLLQEVR